MAYWAVYETATGELRSQGTVVADPLPPGLASKDVGRRNDPGEIWDTAALNWKAGPQQKMQSFLGAVRAHPDYLALTAANRTRVDNAIRAGGVVLGWLVEELHPVA